MNKQELIEKYQQIYEVSNNTDFGLDPFSRGEDAGSSRCSFEIVEDLKKLDEPQKVKVPAFVAEWFEENKHNLNFAIYELCEAGKVPVDLYEGLTDFERWFYLNHDIDTLIRMQDGYEVDKSKWVVNEGDLVIRKGEHEAKVYFVEAVHEDGILLVNGIKDEFFTDLVDRSIDEESVSYFYKNFRLLAKKENLEVEKVYV